MFSLLTTLILWESICGEIASTQYKETYWCGISFIVSGGLVLIALTKTVTFSKLLIACSSSMEVSFEVSVASSFRRETSSFSLIWVLLEQNFVTLTVFSFFSHHNWPAELEHFSGTIHLTSFVDEFKANCSHFWGVICEHSVEEQRLASFFNGWKWSDDSMKRSVEHRFL